MKRRTSRGINFNIFQYLQTACLVESGRLKSSIRNRNRKAAYFHAGAKSMLRLCSLPECNLEFAGFITDCPFNTKQLSQVAVAAFVERPHQPDTGLDS